MANSDAIKHVILVLLENRSFDHLLGWMSHPKYGGDARIDGLTGDLDPATGELVTDTYRNPANNHAFRPLFVETDDKLAVDLPHARSEVTTQLWPGATGEFEMRGFAKAYFDLNTMQGGPNVTRCDCMRMLTPAAIPVTAFLAKNFAVCDRWFTPIPTDTHPNRMMSLSGYTEIDRTSSIEPDQYLMVDWAQDHGVPWRVYSDDFSFLMCLQNKQTGAMRGLDILKERAINGKYRSFSSFAKDLQRDDDFPALTIIEPSYSDDPFATEPNDNHPPLPMGPGEAFVLKIYNAFFGSDLARQRFDDTLLLVYYDEHGGFFDHVPPIKVLTPSGQLNTTTKWDSFTSSGPRVPAIVVSPRVNAGVFKKTLDHTSVLRFLGERFGGGAYSPEVTKRHATSELVSLGDVIDRADARDVPPPPQVGMLPTWSRPNGGDATTPGQQAFLQARQHFHEDHANLVAKAHPESFFTPRRPGS